MIDDPRACYAALAARDPRYDGRFFVGVQSTGVFCRPVCPARTPRQDRVTFFPSAAAAGAAGFRACLRCRPETAPGSAAWAGTGATVQRALRLVDEGALDEGGVPALAERLGISDRRLRALFRRHVGASPAQVAQSRRLHAARLLLDTGLPLGEVALLAGFGSVRRFNDAVRAGFGRTPTELRRGSGPAAGTLRIALATRPPFDGPGLLGFLGARAVPGIERVDGSSWEHHLPSGDRVRAEVGESSVVAEVPASAARSLPLLVRRLRRLFDLDADPEAVAQAVPHAPPGLRLPGAFDPFVTAVRVVLGQQVNVAAATTLAGRLVERVGYPTPDVLEDANLDGLGLPGARIRALRSLAGAVRSGELSLVGLPDRDRLCALRGIGPWTAEVLALRVYGDPDAWPATDLVLAARAAGVDPERFRPFRAYAALAFWRNP